MKNIVKNIPNILTICRIALIPFIIYFSFMNNIKLTIILILIAEITDFLDGLIARNFHLVSPIGAKLDTIADKLFAGSLIISLIIENKLFILCLIGEIIITIINILSFAKKQNPATTYIGKIKTTILFITICLGFISQININIITYVNIFIYISLILQILSIISYINYMLNFHKIVN